MALDLILQCMPEGCPLLDEAESDPDAWQAIFHFESYIRRAEFWLRYGERHPNVVQYVHRCQQLKAANPGLVERGLFLGRRFHVLHFLLTRLVSPEHQQEIDFALPIFHAPISARPTTFEADYYRLSTGQVIDVCQVLEAIPKERLADAWDAPAMRAAKIYKGPHSDDELISTYVMDDFEQLKAFFRVATDHREEVACSYI